MVSDLVSQGGNFLNDGRLKGMGYPEIVGSPDPQGVFKPGKAQAVLRTGIYVMAEDYKSMWQGGWGLRDFGFRISDFGRQNGDFGLEIGDFRLEIGD
jgi:hypothetical protein